ncbi:MAG: glucan biosynthesis protein G [Phycisphaeraceae bacterium]|nr:glucan biosynthesis protein G [Phycisphaeraceae bacterium]
MNHASLTIALGGICVCVIGAVARADEPEAFSFDWLIAEAQRLAASPPRELADDLPPPLGQLDYDQWRQIAFVPQRTLFLDEQLSFQAQFYHRGNGHRRRMAVSWVDPQTAAMHPIDYDPTMFNFCAAPRPDDALLTPQLGFAGMKILTPLNRSADQPYDELISFLGASYFRALGKGQVYGTSARGIAIDTGLSDTPEQFPAFTHLYLVKPQPGDQRVVIGALLEGQSLTGAYQFTVEPGDVTRVVVEARLFFRDGCRTLGLAPLTSMFEAGENDPPSDGDYRPEVHDADGLLVRDAAGDLWRPLHNPRHLAITDLPADQPVGFGLLQRDRDFDHYQDLEAHYQRRPNVWVRFDQSPGPGAVRLIELPTDSEYADNVVAFWLAQDAPEAGRTLHLRYTLLFCSDPSPGRTLDEAGAIVTNSFFDRMEDGRRRVLLDYAGPGLPAVQDAADVGDLGVRLTDDQAVQRDTVTLLPVPEHNAWRVTFVVGDQTGTPPLRVQLTRDGQPVGETWLDPWEPKS